MDRPRTMVEEFDRTERFVWVIIAGVTALLLLALCGFAFAKEGDGHHIPNTLFRGQP